MERNLKIRVAESKLVVAETVSLTAGDELKIIPVEVGTDVKATKMKAYELEYQQTQEHYRDGYRAVWTNFSYITIAIAGILALGSRAPLASTTTATQSAGLSLAWLIVFSSGLWLFWWAATFRPLDDYGEERAKVLEGIEAKMNDLLGEVVLTHWTKLNKFRTERRWRVKNVVNWVAVPIVAVFFFYGLYNVVFHR